MRSLFALSVVFYWIISFFIVREKANLCFFCYVTFSVLDLDYSNVLICEELDFDLNKLLIHLEINVFLSSKGFLDAFSRYFEDIFDNFTFKDLHANLVTFLYINFPALEPWVDGLSEYRVINLS